MTLRERKKPLLYVYLLSLQLTLCSVVVHKTFVPNGLSHPYDLEESTFILRGIRSNFSFLFLFSMKLMSANRIANRIAPDGTPRLAASHLGLFCLPMSHKKDARLIWVKKEPSTSSIALSIFRFFELSRNIVRNQKTF